MLFTLLGCACFFNRKTAIDFIKRNAKVFSLNAIVDVRRRFRRHHMIFTARAIHSSCCKWMVRTRMCVTKSANGAGKLIFGVVVGQDGKSTKKVKIVSVSLILT